MISLKLFIRKHSPGLVGVVRTVRYILSRTYQYSRSIIYFKEIPDSSETVDIGRLVIRKIETLSELIGYAKTSRHWDVLNLEILKNRFEAGQICYAGLDADQLIIILWLVTDSKSPYTPEFPKLYDLKKNPYLCGAMIRRDCIVRRKMLSDFYQAVFQTAGYRRYFAMVFKHNRFGRRVAENTGGINCGEYQLIKLFGFKKEIFTFTTQIEV